MVVTEKAWQKEKNLQWSYKEIVLFVLLFDVRAD